jgi:serine/threonine-protein kinase
VTQQASEVRARDGAPPKALRGGQGAGARAAARRALSLSGPQLALALLGAAAIAGLQAYFSLAPWGLFLAVFALAFAQGLGRGRAGAREASAPVQSFGQYTLVRKLGEGGMGVVYEARHALLRRPTALKLLRKFPDEDPAAAREAVQRFEREVQLTSQLSHPNTIAIYDYGQNDEGAFYYAMEYIDGVDLDRLVRVDGPLAPAHVIHLALQICGSLAEAHARSLIHRDIKPSNLLVYERAGVPDTIKVLDFGLVKSLHGPIVSAAHVLVGTPLYTAPEVLDDPSRASPRSDIYALGAVLHWLATGKTLQEAAVAATSPSASLPVDLERLIMRCTEADPAERPESMKALARELTACRDYGQWTEQSSRAYWDDRGKRLSHLLAQPVAPDANTLAAS